MSAAKLHLTRETLLGLLKQMTRVRRFEEKCAELYQAEKIRGFLHLAVGEEAISTAVMAALTPDDAVVATYREHGHALVRGVPARDIMAEMYGKMEGCSRGRGGSMHLFNAAHRFYGGYAIVGGGLPLAAGLALADKMAGRTRVTVCFFGEGAAAEGEFHETMNLAALWKLPILFVCENNLYAMGTRLDLSESETDIHAKAQAYRIASESIDGMDVVAVDAAANRAIADIKNGGGPHFVECRTYRFRAHSMFDPQLYRTKAEVEEWKERDPIPRLANWMRGAGMLHDKDVEEIEAAVKAEIDDAVAYAEAGKWEPVSELTRHVYAEAAR
jgi:pyruvate dehydrogenase E1 component alpha subunit